MKTEDWDQLEAVFAAGQDLPTLERPAYWENKFNDNPTMRAELELLINGEQDAKAVGFLDKPAWSFVETDGAMKEDAMIGQTVGGYKILSRVGGGGMGDVYLAYDDKLKREVALKLVKDKDLLNRDAIARFEDEKRILCKIEHDNVARLYDGGMDDHRPFIVMEYLRDFISLREHLRAHPSQGLPLQQVKEIVRQTCIGLAQAHALGIVHRDVKPENIMLLINQDGIRVKVIDFGIAIPPQYATHEDSSGIPTHRPSLISPGTTVYKSPEQLENKPREAIKATSDIYSFGLVIYEMLTGRLAYPSEEHRLYGRMSPPVRDMRSGAGDNIDPVLKRALNENPAERQPDIRALSLAVMDALPAVDARPSAPTEIVTPDVVPAINPGPAVPDTQPMPLKPKPWGKMAGVGASAVMAIALLTWTLWPKGAPVATPASNPPVVTASAKTTQLSLTLQRNNESLPATSNTVFHTNDRLRFKLKVEQDGQLYVLNQSSDGSMSVLFPHQSINQGNNRVVANQLVQFPPPDNLGLRLDEKTGTDTFYFIVTPAGLANDELTAPLQAVIQKNGTKESYPVLNLASLGDWFTKLTTSAATNPAELGTAAETVTLSGNGTFVKAVRLLHER